MRDKIYILEFNINRYIMIRAGYFIVILILLTPSLFINSVALDEDNFSEIISSGQHGQGYRYNIQGWVYLHIEGEPYDRGYQYGYLASAEIIEMMQRWSNIAHTSGFMKVFILKNQPENYDELSEKWWDICRSESMKKFFNQVPEEYKQEMQGMTDGLKDRGAKIFGRDIEFEDVVASQFVQDVQYAISKFNKGIHPLRGAINGLKDLLTGDILNYEGHCHVFIATGDATSDGGIVVAHETVFNPYIAQRCNFIVDVQPSNGNRFLMTCPPGSLWSQEDWYQNDKGIILTETEMTPQGPWKVRRNAPKGVRSRTAIQYSDDIDDVIKNLKNGNNGLIPNEWIIGDIKTGEIASYQQALYNTPIKRTFNGYYQSNCYPQDINVLSELTGLPKFVLKMYPKIFSKNALYTIEDETVIWNEEVYQKLKEMGEKYYGEIDENIAKKIMSTYPITKRTTDCKITTSNLMENLGLLLYMGVPNGTTLIPSEDAKEKFQGFTELAPSGWVELYPSNSEISVLSSTPSFPSFVEDALSLGSTNEIKDSSKILWQHDTTTTGITNYSSSIVSGDTVYASTSTGMVYALDSHKGREKWSITLAETTVDPVLSGDIIFIGTDIGLHAINKENGKTIWEQTIGRIASKPVISGNNIIAGCKTGEIYVFDIESGNKIWDYTLPDAAYISEMNGNNVFYVGSGKTCYGFDYTNKEKIWDYETNGLITSAPREKGETVYFGSWDGKLYAVNAKTGEKQWSYETGWGIDSTPDISDGVVFVGSLDNNFYALDVENGNPIWYYNCKSAIHTNPIAYGDYVFFGCDDGRLYALNQDDGDLAWSFAPGYYISDSNVNNYITTPILSNPYVEDGVIYIGAKGKVYALDAQTFEKPVEKEGKTEFDITNMIIAVILLVAVCLFFLYVFRKKDGAHKK